MELIETLKAGFLFFFSSENVPAWGSFCAAASAIFVARQANKINVSNSVSSLKFQLAQIDVENLEKLETCRLLLINFQSNHKDLIQKNNLPKELEESLLRLDEFDDDVKEFELLLKRINDFSNRAHLSDEELNQELLVAYRVKAAIMRLHLILCHKTAKLEKFTKQALEDAAAIIPHL